MTVKGVLPGVTEVLNKSYKRFQRVLSDIYHGKPRVQCTQNGYIGHTSRQKVFFFYPMCAVTYNT